MEWKEKGMGAVSAEGQQGKVKSSQVGAQHTRPSSRRMSVPVLRTLLLISWD